MGMSLNNHLSLIRTVHSAFTTPRFKEKKEESIFFSLNKACIKPESTGFLSEPPYYFKALSDCFFVNKGAQSTKEVILNNNKPCASLL